MWRAKILTLFPEMLPGPLGFSLAGKALAEGLWSMQTVDIRAYARDRHATVDDTPFGGGPGMVMRPDVVSDALRAEADPAKGRAFKLSTAIFFATLVTLVAFISTLAGRWIGPAGAIGAAALAGFADAHAASAAVASVAASDQLGLAGAQLGVLLALSTNTITKAVLAATSGPRSFSVRVILGLGLVLLVTWGVAAMLLLRA